MTTRQELVSKTYSLNDRLRLFDATVSPTLLYGCEAWTLIKEHEDRLQSTQRKMLRMILGSGRQRIIAETCADSVDVDSDAHESLCIAPDMGNAEVLEPWTEWIKRVTHRAEDQLEKLNIQSWI